MLYEVAPDYLERRGLYRAEHLELAWAAVQRCELLLGGAICHCCDPPAAALSS